MFLMFVLYGCVGSEGSEVGDTAAVDEIDPRFGNCTVMIDGEDQDSNGDWQARSIREQSFDRWGNLIFDRIQVWDQMTYQLEQTYEDSRLLTRREERNIGASTVLTETYTWDGPFLLRVESVQDGVASVTDYTSDGVDPYNDSSTDEDGDGEVDSVSDFSWGEDGLTLARYDEGADGTIDARYRWEYDSEGRQNFERFTRGIQYQIKQWEWGGPFDSVLLYTFEIGTDMGPLQLYTTSTDWSGDWTEVSYEVVLDEELEESGFETFDTMGRRLTRLREFPQYNSSRETWTWDCPQ